MRVLVWAPAFSGRCNRATKAGRGPGPYVWEAVGPSVGLGPCGPPAKSRPSKTPGYRLTPNACVHAPWGVGCQPGVDLALAKFPVRELEWYPQHTVGSCMVRCMLLTTSPVLWSICSRVRIGLFWHFCFGHDEVCVCVCVCVCV